MYSGKQDWSHTSGPFVVFWVFSWILMISSFCESHAVMDKGHAVF